jgi:hypothetical protein
MYLPMTAVGFKSTTKSMLEIDDSKNLLSNDFQLNYNDIFIENMNKRT